jgi:hypothetical protein
MDADLVYLVSDTKASKLWIKLREEKGSRVDLDYNAYTYYFKVLAVLECQ